MKTGMRRATTRVLMVEDNPVDVDLLQLAFSQINDWPLETTVVADGEKAIQLLQEQASNRTTQPDLVLLDLNIPRRDGTEVLQMIRSTESLNHLPVAVLSSSPRDVIQRKLTAAGVLADGHFTKPLDIDEFLELGQVLRGWYERHEEQRTRP